ncbi:hypothetical protein L6452_34354 [Arctium lappa]|uniref:Uncharacterized protein n=1 Tax=Arctium lappa TaxID=4217 RepID=A0ACB8YM74_ARCLA|nr:hypothetical protein L6452_34354 [Arctium lappa]
MCPAGGYSSYLVPTATLGAMGVLLYVVEGKVATNVRRREIHNMANAVATVSKQLENVSDVLASTKRHLSKRLENLDWKLDEQKEMSKLIADDVNDVKSNLNQIGYDINMIHQMVSGLVLKQDNSQLSLQAHQCPDTVPDLNNMVYAVQALVAQCEDLKMKYNEEQAKRRKLHNQIEDEKGNIRVFFRCRPLSKTEASAECSTIVEFDATGNGELGVINSGSTKKTFRFDRVFTPSDNQVDVFAHASPLVTSVLDGYNVCIFTYGQTGTGKTFTIEGIEGNRGVNYRTLEELFKISKERIVGPRVNVPRSLRWAGTGAVTVNNEPVNTIVWSKIYGIDDGDEVATPIRWPQVHAFKTSILVGEEKEKDDARLTTVKRPVWIHRSTLVERDRELVERDREWDEAR